MRSNKNSALLTTAAMAAIFGGFPMAPRREVEKREPTVPTEKETEWLTSLNSIRRDSWTRRFQRGLTAEQRQYIDEQLKEMDNS